MIQKELLLFMLFGSLLSLILCCLCAFCINYNSSWKEKILIFSLGSWVKSTWEKENTGAISLYWFLVPEILFGLTYYIFTMFLNKSQKSRFSKKKLESKIISSSTYTIFVENLPYSVKDAKSVLVIIIIIIFVIIHFSFFLLFLNQFIIFRSQIILKNGE